jgi:hypothetical protein
MTFVLNVHLRQRLLHPLDAGADGADVVAALAPVGPVPKSRRIGFESLIPRVLSRYEISTSARRHSAVSSISPRLVS